MAPAGSQQLRAQDPAPARRCSTEGETERQGKTIEREGRNGDGNRDGGGNENKDEKRPKGGDGGENGSGDGDEHRGWRGERAGEPTKCK